MITDEEKHHEEDSEVEDEEPVRMAPDIGAGGPHLQAMTDPEEEEEEEGRRRRRRRKGRKMMEGRMGRP